MGSAKYLYLELAQQLQTIKKEYLLTHKNMQIKEKMHVPVTICFPDYAFNEYAHISFFQK